MDHYVVSGRFRNGDGYATFETTVDADNENIARERVFSQLGSRHGVKRTQVELSEVESR